MTNPSSEDPLIGDEVLEIRLHPYHVHFVFVGSILQLGAPFEVGSQGFSTTVIDPEKNKGDLAVLWSLVGKVVSTVNWNETLTITFTDNTVISIDPNNGQLRGTIMGRHDMTIEDF